MTHNNLLGGWVWDTPGQHQQRRHVMNDEHDDDSIQDLTVRTEQLEEEIRTIRARVEALERSRQKDRP